ncbi:hypothetical protein [Candidatus Chlamydia sanziniae]|uniref:Uncharacterized protein n=1 Tax=Candidatus Chlamydia sanziniae TaxID=1806891 RepID=A0A1A9HWU4_9CHLA|nr:hypothetical protein [Candidatus Chlamydia sanziniae]ANH79167.1 hypothetical protein Cs308_0997 [Candidatus Chlamydia sanziniae]
MLAFFYKHQKKFIGFIIVIVCVSGVGIGWGRFSCGEHASKIEFCRVVFTTASGKKYLEKDVLAIKKFLMHEAYPFTGNPKEWNFVNEGLLTQHFLTTKLGEKLFFRVYSQGFPAFAKEKNYQPYRRFDAPFISSEEVWKSSVPRLVEILNRFQQIDNPVSPEGFAFRVQLFLEEKKFPHYVLRQMLEYRRQRFALPEDSALSRGKDLRLFGYRNVRDWFGDAYLSAAVEVLLRFIDAERRFLVLPSLNEARDDFYDKAKRAFTKLSKYSEFSLSFNQFIAFYFQFLGLSETEFFKMYREILLCKRAFLLLQGSVAFDYQPLCEFFYRGKDSTEVELVNLPKEYCFKTEQDLLAFETYIYLVAPPLKDPLDVPYMLLPIKIIKAKEPRLIGKRFAVSYQTVALEDLETKVPLVEVDHWQQNPEHFQEILQEFTAAETCQSPKDFQCLKTSLRDKISVFTRKAILRAYPERITEALRSASIESREILLSPGKDSILEGIVDGQALANVLLENEIIERYSQDQERYYTFKVETCFDGEEVLSYREVLKKGLASKLVNAYGNALQSDRILNALRARYPKETGSALWQRRLWKLMEEHRAGTYPGGTFFWGLEKSLRTFTREDSDLPQPFDQLFAMEIDALSGLIIHSEEGPYYYRCLGHAVNDCPMGIDRLFFAKNRLNEEVVGSYMERFIGQGVG